MSEFWDDDERAAWRPPEKLDSSQWAEKYRLMTRRQTNRPGRWLDANQPATRVFMKLATHRAVREIWVKKYAQGGWSEAVRNIIGRRAHLAPCPVQIVLPNRDKGREIVRKRLIPLFEDTPVLAELLTGRRFDKKMTAIALKNGFELSLGYSGSPTSVASDPFALVILDEVDKFDYRGMQADPIEEARVRTRTFGDQSLVIALSTPSTPDGPISRGYDECPIKLFLHVPCPHCGIYQQFTFDNLVWDKGPDPETWKQMTLAERGAWVEFNKAAWIRCSDHVRCAATYPAGGGKITEKHKRQMMLRSYWATRDGGWKLHYDGREEGRMPDATMVGIQIGAFCDLTTPYWKIAAKAINAGIDPAKLKNFYNLTLGEEFRLQVQSATVGVYDRKSRVDVEAGRPVVLPPKVVPVWASRLVMTVDTQKDYFWYVIRAWGYNFRSARVDHGRVSTFGELESLIYEARWPYAGDAFAPLRVYIAGIDTGGGIDNPAADATRTDQVYQWCNVDPMLRIPLKGAHKEFEQHIQWREITYQDPMGRRDPYRVRLHLVDPMYWRDLLDSYIGAKIPVVDQQSGEVTELERWGLNSLCDSEYNRHLSNVHKTQLKKAGGFVTRWMPKTVGARHDYHDLESYQLAMAHGPARCGMLPSPAELAAMARPAAETSGGISMPDGRPFLANRR